MNIKFLLLICFYLSSLTNDEICKEYENEKHFNFNFQEFKNAFHRDEVEKTDKVFEDYYNDNNKITKFIFQKFKMIKKERKPIILYNQELIETRTNKLSKENIDGLDVKITKVKNLINKTLEFIENFLIMNTDPIKNFEFQISYESFHYSLLEDIFTGKESIYIKNFDYYLFIDFEYNKEESYTAYNISNFSFLRYHSRPILGYLKINLYYLSDAKVKYEEIMTLAHEILHSFGLVNKDLIESTMKKLYSLDQNNKIKQFIKKENDFYKLYSYLKSNNLLEKLFDKTSHFNPNYLYNDIMQPSKVYIKHFTDISSGLFEILTNYEIRINKKILKKNYDTCLPILKALFKNNCDNSSGNFIKSLNSKNNIKLNNKCSKIDGVANNFCDNSYQFKRYCNYFNNSINNLSCYQSISDKKSNCFDHSNNNKSIKSNFDFNEINQYYGAKSNCFEIQNISNNDSINPVCFKNDLDLKNNKINIFIKENKENEKLLNCNYKVKYDQILKENIFEKIEDTIEYNKDGNSYKIFCPDMNKFYKDNLSNLCKNDCYLNGRCIGLNKCECFNGFDPTNNCKTLLKGYPSKINRINYLFDDDRDDDDDKFINNNNDEPKDNSSETDSISEPEDNSSETDSISEPKDNSSETDSISEPEDNSSETDSISEPKDNSSETDSISKPEDNSSETDSISEPEDNSSETDSISEPKDNSSETDSISKPEDNSSETDSISEPKDNSSETDSISEPEDNSSETDSISEPEDNSSETDSISEPEDNSTKKDVPKDNVIIKNNCEDFKNKFLNNLKEKCTSKRKNNYLNKCNENRKQKFLNRFNKKCDILKKRKNKFLDKLKIECSKKKEKFKKICLDEKKKKFLENFEERCSKENIEKKINNCKEKQRKKGLKRYNKKCNSTKKQNILRKCSKRKENFLKKFNRRCKRRRNKNKNICKEEFKNERLNNIDTKCLNNYKKKCNEEKKNLFLKKFEDKCLNKINRHSRKCSEQFKNRFLDRFNKQCKRKNRLSKIIKRKCNDNFNNNFLQNYENRCSNSIKEDFINNFNNRCSKVNVEKFIKNLEKKCSDKFKNRFIKKFNRKCKKENFFLII